MQIPIKIGFSSMDYTLNHSYTNMIIAPTKIRKLNTCLGFQRSGFLLILVWLRSPPRDLRVGGDGGANGGVLALNHLESSLLSSPMAVLGF